MTTSVTHLWRLLKWGRTLARHGALTGIEEDPLTPPPVRRLARVARLGAKIPPTPDYARALQEIEKDIRDVEKDIVRLLAEVTGAKAEEIVE